MIFNGVLVSAVQQGELAVPQGESVVRSVHSISHVQLFEIPWTVIHQTSWSVGVSRQEYSSGLPFPSPLRESEK